MTTQNTTYEVKKYILPAVWASYLINGDDSGISEENKSNADKFLQANSLPSPVSCEEVGFKWCNDFNNIGGDCDEYSFLISK